MSEAGWLGAVLASARPQAVAALLRYFLDIAEEAFQEASLRALQNWPRNGPPRDPAAWLIMVGRNAAIDGVRRRERETPLPPEEEISDRCDVEARLAEQLDEAGCRDDDILRLLFVCCHPELPATQQIALALRLLLPWRQRCLSPRTRTARRGAPGVQPGDRAGDNAGRGGAYPP